MTLLETRQPDFPENPGDGFQIQETLPDGSVVTWTYDAQFNEWTYAVANAPLNDRVYSENVILSRPVTQAVGKAIDEYKILGPSVIGDPTGRYGQHEANELFLYNDTDLQDQVDKLGDKVDSLVAGTTHAKWRFDIQEVPGTWRWNGSGSNDYNQAPSQLDVSKTDLNGQGYEPADFRVGDELHITNADGTGHLWAKITSIINGGPASMSLTYTKVDGIGVATGEQIFSIKADLDMYVRKEGGDSMEGPLKVSGTRDGSGDNGESTVETLNVDSGQNSSLQLKMNGTTTVYVGKNDFTLTTDLKFNTPNKHIYAGADKKGIEVNSSGVLYKGDISAADHLITKEYSDLEDLVLDAKITELRVEMDALAPIDASGIYRWQDIGTLRPPAIGQFILLSEDLSTPVDQYGQSGGIWVHQTDWESVAHDFTEVHVGELIQLFDRYEPEFVLGEITEVQDGGLQPDHSGSLIIKYERIASNGGPDYGSGADPLVNLKVYRKPTDDGTGESAYLPVKGGTMQGAIDMEGNKIRFHGENSNRDHIHFSRESGTYINALRLDHPTGSQENGGYDIRLIGHSSYNWLRLCGLSNGDQPLVTARASGEIKFVHDNIRFNNNKLREVGPAVSDTDAVNLGQIKEGLAELRDEFLQDLIVGRWNSDNFQTLSTAAQNRFITVTSNGQAATKLADVGIIRFNYRDNSGSDVQWDHWDPGEIVTLRQTDDPSVVATYRLLTAVSVNGDTRSFSVEFLNAQNDSDQAFAYFTEYAVTLTEFSDGFNGAELDTLYYRVDGSNGPLKEPVTVSTNNEYGEAGLILEGKRDNPSNAAGVLRFTNTLSTDGPGEISYYTYGSVRKFTFNENIDLGDKLLGLGNIQFTSSGGEIRSGTHIRIKLQNPSKSGNGLAAVHVSRAPGDTRRTFGISGKNTSGAIEDIFYAYTKSTGDYIVYKGVTSISNSIQTRDSVQALINASAFAVVDAEGDPHFGDHRLEDVGVPVAATDAATKGYVDQVAGKKTWQYTPIVSVPPEPGTFSFDNNSTTFYISGTTAEGTQLLSTSLSTFNDYNVTGIGSLYDQGKGGVLTGFFKFETVRVQAYGGDVYYKITRTGYGRQDLLDGNNYEIKVSGLI